MKKDFIKNMLKNFLALFLSLLFCAIVLEIALRIHNPFPMRIRGEKIELPVYNKFIIRNINTNKLDNPIIYTRNSLGFRGEERPRDINNYFSILTVGGSTTECLYLSDNKTWSYLLGKRLKEKFRRIWLNNAGLDGHSTYGHVILLRDYLIELKPKMIIFLIGINDVGQDKSVTILKDDDIRNVLARKSELAAFLLNTYRVLKAKHKNLGHRIIDLKKEKTLILSDEEIQKTLEEYKKDHLKYYENRLLAIIDMCKKNGIAPVFVTQPFLLGDTTDKTTGVYLGNIKYTDHQNGVLFWDLLELYNRTTIKIANENNVLVVDLANKLPKDSKYYYDFAHYSNKGAEEIARILSSELEQPLEKRINERR